MKRNHLPTSPASGTMELYLASGRPVSDRAALFANVLDQPADDTARLVVAILPSAVIAMFTRTNGNLDLFVFGFEFTE